MSSQANGIVAASGPLDYQITNSLIDSVYSNGIRLYSENDTNDSLWAHGTLFDFERNAASGSAQGNPLDPTRTPAAYITHCGIDIFAGVTPFSHSLSQQDERHGVRIAFQPRTGQDTLLTFNYFKLFDVGIGYCKGAGIAIRNDGWVKTNDRNIDSISQTGFDYHLGRLELFGCMVNNNGFGIDVNGNMHGVGLFSQQLTGHTRAVITRICHNDSSGISVAPR